MRHGTGGRLLSFPAILLSVATEEWYLQLQSRTRVKPGIQTGKERGKEYDLFRIIKAVSIMPVGDQFLQPFGINSADLPRMPVN